LVDTHYTELVMIQYNVSTHYYLYSYIVIITAVSIVRSVDRRLFSNDKYQRRFQLRTGIQNIYILDNGRAYTYGLRCTTFFMNTHYYDVIIIIIIIIICVQAQ